MPPTVEIQSLTKRFNTLTSVDNISLVIEQGQMVAILRV